MNLITQSHIISKNSFFQNSLKYKELEFYLSREFFDKYKKYYYFNKHVQTSKTLPVYQSLPTPIKAKPDYYAQSPLIFDFRVPNSNLIER